MIRFSNTLTINRPVEEVFELVSNFENMPKWNYFVVSVRKVSDGPIGMGSSFDQVRKTDRQRYEVSEYVRNQRVSVKTLPPAPPLKMRFIFEKIGDATRLTDEWELETGRNPLLEWLGTMKIKSAVAENLEKLRQLLETGETRLQDGRTMRI